MQAQISGFVFLLLIGYDSFRILIKDMNLLRVKGKPYLRAYFGRSRSGYPGNHIGFLNLTVEIDLCAQKLDRKSVV